MAAAILALVIASALAASQRAFSALDTARNLETAAAIMETELEKERVLPWATVSSAAYAPVIDSGITSQPSLAGRFTLSRTTAVVAGHGGNMLQITLTVTWRSYDGHNHSRTHTTYYANGGLYDYFANPSSS
jgi:hypothetical protein